MHPLPENPELPGQPASIGARFAAGILDALALALITGVLYYVPLRMGAFALPLLGGLAAILGWVVVPCAFLRGTLFMRLLGLEIIGMDGRRPDLGELLSRELLGRGWIGFAYFSTWIVGIVGMLSGSIVFFQPRGIGLVLFFVSGTIVLLSLCGQAIIFSRRDGRGLPDLMAKTMIIRRGTAKAPEEGLDEEEKRALEQASMRRIRNVAVFDVILLGGAIGLPYFLSRPSTSASDFQARVRLATAEKTFNANPSNPDAAAELTDLLKASGDEERAKAVLEKHEGALRTVQNTQEEALKAAMKRNPKDWDSAATLIGLYEQQGRLDEAKATFRSFLENDPTTDNRVGYGVWLYEHHGAAEAIPHLERAIKEGTDSAEPHAYLGWAYMEQKRYAEARDAFEHALDIDPDLEDVQRDLAATMEHLEGDEKGAPKKPEDPQPE